MLLFCLMLLWIKLKLHFFSSILLAPIYYHFGHYSIVIDIITLGGEIVDTLGLFFLVFIFLISITFYKNLTFQVFVKSFFKNYIFSFNFTPLLTYISTFFKNFLKLISFLLNKILFFFKKKK